MPSQRKRKHASVQDEQTTTQSKSSKIQKSLHSFGTVGKRHDGNNQSKEIKLAKATPIVKGITVKSANKRKHQVDSDEEDEIAVCQPVSPVEEEEETIKTKSAPRSKRVKTASLPTPESTPTRGTLALFDRLNIDGNARAIPCELQKTKNAYDTPPDTPVDAKSILNDALPDELRDLQDLYSSFLASLSLYYSHNGSTSPVNMRELLPMITNHWGRREVNLVDVQRVISVAHAGDRQFYLQDYGRAGVCVTRDQTDRRPTSFIDEEKLNTRFRDQLLQNWTSWQTTALKENVNPTHFIAQIPLSSIPQSDTVTKAATLFARGQNRLADLKASRAQTSQPTPSPAPSQYTPHSSTTQNRSTALLDRILTKQAHTSTLPSGPTKSQLLRRSALHRIEDVVRVLSLLVGPKDRASFSLPAIIQHLQQSLRNPISLDEGERCLDLLSNEIIPGFAKMVRSGEVTGVVVFRAKAVGLAEVRRRVEGALGEM